MKKAKIHPLLLTAVILLVFACGFAAGRSTGLSPVELTAAHPSTASVPEITDAPATPLLDLNTATRQQLESLPGIGPALAGRILSYREAHGFFSSPEQLLQVEGIGQKKLEALLEYVCTGGSYENSGCRR